MSAKKEIHAWFSFSFCRNLAIHTDEELMIARSVTRILNFDLFRDT